MQTENALTIEGLMPTLDEVRALPDHERQAVENRAADAQRIASAGIAALGHLVADASITASRPQGEQIQTGELIAMLAELEASAGLIADEYAGTR